MEMTSKKHTTPIGEPRGFGEHARGLAGENAHQQGWGLNQDERTRISGQRQDIYGSAGYVGDEPVNVARTATTENVAHAWAVFSKGAEQ